MRIKPGSIQELQSYFQGDRQFLPAGGMTKPALSTPTGNFTGIDVSDISGVIEYDPQEFTISVYAGTTTAEINRILARNHQFLAFDPPLVKQGATIGGTVAAGLSGPGRYRCGGIRDFILGVDYVNADGRLIHGGGKVVKNAAGFDLPKLVTGSLGSLGILVKLCIKTLPRPERSLTLRIDFDDLDSALHCQADLFSCPLDLAAVDLVPDTDLVRLFVRIAGSEAAIALRMERLLDHVGSGEVMDPGEAQLFWGSASEFEWVPGNWILVKVPITPLKVLQFETLLTNRYGVGKVSRRYSSGCQVAWVAIEADTDILDRLLVEMNLPGLVLFGPPDRKILGNLAGKDFWVRIKSALDPRNRFMDL